jgi:hypothetical protein
MNQYSHRADFSVLALGLAALVPGLACDWAGPASRVSARAASAGLLTPLHLM